MQESTLPCVSDAGFCSLMANSTQLGEPWDLGAALPPGPFGVRGYGKSFSVIGGAVFLGACAHFLHGHKALGLKRNGDQY